MEKKDSCVLMGGQGKLAVKHTNKPLSYRWDTIRVCAVAGNRMEPGMGASALPICKRKE
jgi:hypothetical protein